MRVAVFFVAAGLASCLAADSGKWVAPLAPRHVEPPRAGLHPIDAFLGSAAPVVPDAVFLRRAYLDLWGLLPTPEQVAAFEKDSAKDKRERLIDNLLANKENYSSHWITFWNDLLRNEEGVIYHGERKSITPWLKKALAANMPYDQFVAHLLNPTQPGDPEGFLTGVTWRGVVNASELPPMQAAQNSAQIFLGINLKCNSCHDSFISTWKLKDAYGLASFFSDGPLELVRCDVKQGKTAETKFLFPELGPVPQGMPLPQRRAAAARLFTTPENGRLARTYVNRMWAQLFGQGLVSNVDDMAARPSNPDLLDWLAADFTAHGYDTQYLLKLLMTSRAYQSPSAPKRRISAEEFIDAVSAMTGEWRVLEDRSTKSGVYAREWRFKSSPLSRALGRPIRDQVTTVRLTQPTTLQALELVNGATLSTLLSRGALRLQDRLPPAPASLFDSGSIRGQKSKPQVDIDVSGVNELWLLMTDVDSYDPAHVNGGFVDAELSGPGGTQRVAEIASLSLPAEQKIDLRGKGYTRFRATVALDVASTTSDVNGAVRFFVFGAKPDYTRLLPVHGAPPVESKPAANSSREELVRWLYRYAYTREPSAKEMALAAGEESLEDLLWAMVMSPEFQYIR